MTELPRTVFGDWLHSFEEDTEDIAVFRPSGYHFPAARGRRGFELHEDGRFVRYEIAPGDGLRALPGRWRALDTRTIEAEVEGRMPSVFEVAEADASVLKLRFPESKPR
jgi:hypothetical protein